MGSVDMAVYTFTKGSAVEVEVFDPQAPPMAPEYSVIGTISRIEKADGKTKIYVMGADDRFIIVLEGEV